MAQAVIFIWLYHDVIYELHHAQMGLMSYVVSVAQDKPALSCSLVRSYPDKMLLFMEILIKGEIS